MSQIRRVILILSILAPIGGVSAQVLNDSLRVESDSLENVEIKKEKRGSIFSGRPGKAFLLSMILPGTGQIYNKSYLRVPVVYAAIGGMGWVLVYNTQQYTCFKTAYIAKVDNVFWEPPKYCKDVDLIRQKDLSTLKELRDNANKYRQRSIVLFSAIWLANGIDAFVDAHLKQFDIDDDLSIDIGLKNDADPYVPMRYGLYVSF